jgi:hypothetical protein
MSQKLRKPLRKRNNPKELDQDSSKKKKKKSISSSHQYLYLDGDNPFYREVLKLKESIPIWDRFFDRDSATENDHLLYWTILHNNAEKLVNKYAWAIPDDTCLRVLAHFSPLVEIASGKGYWARLLRERGVDVIAVDKYCASTDQANRGENWTEVI